MAPCAKRQNQMNVIVQVIMHTSTNNNVQITSSNKILAVQNLRRNFSNTRPLHQVINKEKYDSSRTRQGNRGRTLSRQAVCHTLQNFKTTLALGFCQSKNKNHGPMTGLDSVRTCRREHALDLASPSICLFACMVLGNEPSCCLVCSK